MWQKQPFVKPEEKLFFLFYFKKYSISINYNRIKPSLHPATKK